MREIEMMKSSAYAGVLVDPGADNPRLELANWLDSRWPERASFIRLQLHNNRVERSILQKRIYGESLNSYDEDLPARRGWDAPIRSLGWVGEPEQPHRWNRGWSFIRGCIAYVRIEASVFLERADELFSLFPIRQISMTNSAPVFGDLMASPFLERLVGLELCWSGLGDRETQLLAECPHVRNLRSLGLQCNRIGMEGFEALCASPYLEGLVDVNLHGNAAPNPTQEAGYEWTGALVVVSGLPPEGEALERKYGYKRWLHTADLFNDRLRSNAFDGDDPV